MIRTVMYTAQEVSEIVSAMGHMEIMMKTIIILMLIQLACTTYNVFK